MTIEVQNPDFSIREKVKQGKLSIDDAIAIASKWQFGLDVVAWLKRRKKHDRPMAAKPQPVAPEAPEAPAEAPEA